VTAPDRNPEGPARAFRVLFVCTANQCRSPLAEYILRDAVGQRWGHAAGSWEISSAGTRTRGGRPMDPAAREVLAERGIDGSGFVGRALTPQLIRNADLVLAATREHRGRIAELEPRALARLFTIQQFGYLARAAAPGAVLDPVDAGVDLLARARAARSQVPGRTVEDDLADPVGHPIAEFRRCAEELDDAIGGMLGAVPAG
jgi:protein-tyrosine phosphatase